MGKIYLGTTELSSLKLGSTTLKKVYKGSDLEWEEPSSSVEIPYASDFDNGASEWVNPVTGEGTTSSAYSVSGTKSLATVEPKITTEMTSLNINFVGEVTIGFYFMVDMPENELTTWPVLGIDEEFQISIPPIDNRFKEITFIYTGTGAHTIHLSGGNDSAGNGVTYWDNMWVGLTSELPAKPTGFNVVCSPNTTFDFSWNSSADADSYEIVYEIGNSSPNEHIVSELTGTFYEGPASSTATMYARIRAKNASGYSAFTNVQSAGDCTPAPGLL